MRGGRREFLYSRVMCWVALDRAHPPRATQALVPGPLARWRDVRDEIYRDIFEHFWDPTRRAFVQYDGRERPRRVAAADAAGQVHQPDRPALAVDPAGDRGGPGRGLAGVPLPHPRGGARRAPGEEGTFTMCSFWYVECLSRVGRRATGAARLREDARLRQPPRPLRRGARPARRAPRQLPAGLHPPRPDQRGLRPRPPALGRGSTS